MVKITNTDDRALIVVANTLLQLMEMDDSSFVLPGSRYGGLGDVDHDFDRVRVCEGAACKGGSASSKPEGRGGGGESGGCGYDLGVTGFP